MGMTTNIPSLIDLRPVEVADLLAVLRATEMHREPDVPMSRVLDLRKKFEYFEHRMSRVLTTFAEDMATN